MSLMPIWAYGVYRPWPAPSTWSAPRRSTRWSIVIGESHGRQELSAWIPQASQSQSKGHTFPPPRLRRSLLRSLDPCAAAELRREGLSTWFGMTTTTIETSMILGAPG